VHIKSMWFLFVAVPLSASAEGGLGLGTSWVSASGMPPRMLAT
jgi:hypothetical protein